MRKRLVRSLLVSLSQGWEDNREVVVEVIGVIKVVVIVVLKLIVAVFLVLPPVLG